MEDAMHTHDDSWRPSRNLTLHPGINFSKLEVGGDIGGLVFAAGSVVAVLIGLPMLAPMYLASMVLGVGVAIVLFAWHRHHPGH
jgi:hypothetical protein